MEEVARSGLENSVVATFSQPVSVLPPQLLMSENGRPHPGAPAPKCGPIVRKVSSSMGGTKPPEHTARELGRPG